MTPVQMKRRHAYAAPVLAIGLAALSASAAIVQSNSVATGTEAAYPCSTADLVNTGQPSFLTRSDTGYAIFNGSSTARLNDGAPGVSGQVATTAFDLDGAWETTFALDTTTHTNGYTITNITTIAGWTGGRQSQKYSVFISRAGDPLSGFSLLGTFQNITATAGARSTRIEIADSSGVIASNVNAIRFLFIAITGNEAVYREVDVSGEPSPLPFLAPAVALPTGGTGPGGLGRTDGQSSLELWLRSDSLTLTNGAAVTNWPDLSGKNRHATPPTAANVPTLRAAVLNGQPAVWFDGTDWVRRASAPITVHDVLVVARSAVTPFPEYSGILGNDPADAAAIYFANGVISTTRLAQGVNSFAVAQRSGAPLPGVGGPDFAPVTNFWIASLQLQTVVSAPAFAVGAISPTPARCWRGEIVEVAAFSGPLNAAERSIAENYASARYGLALAAGADRYAGDEPTNGDYDHGVFGIGCSNSANRCLSGGASGFGLQCLGLEDGEWILAGYREPGGGTAAGRWTRDWYVDATGLDGNERVTLRFDWSDADAGAPDPSFDRLLFCPPDESLFRPVAAGARSDDSVTFELPASRLPDGRYTLGSAPVRTLIQVR